MMIYRTIDIWKGIYSSHQRCLEAVNRLALTSDEQPTALTLSAYVQLLQYRLKTAKGDNKTEAERRLARLTGSKPPKEQPALTSLPEPEAANILPAPLAFVEQLAGWTTSYAVIFLTLIGALTLQVHHVAHLVNRISHSDSLLLGYVFGCVSELTALLLTVHQARRGMLILFAFVQCWINVLYYCRFPDLTVKLTLSALIAFVIYAYSELFTSKHTTNQK